jgi:thiol-disulfide isomerase/thioredoxin
MPAQRSSRRRSSRSRSRRSRQQRGGRVAPTDGAVSAAGGSPPMLDLRKPADVAALKDGGLVLLWADWCPHCHDYMPTWERLAATPGRTLAMARVQDTDKAKLPLFAGATIEGFPTVVAVLPGGAQLATFDAGGGAPTNAVPYMRDVPRMEAVLRGDEPAAPAAGGGRRRRRRH